MPFFEPLPSNPGASRHVDPEWRRVPVERVPVAIDQNRVVASNHRVALVLHSVEVYNTGVCFTLRGVRPPSAEASDRPLFESSRGRRGAPGHLRCGIAFDDGRRATNTDRAGLRRGDDAPAAMLLSPSGAGTDDGFQTTFWVWPLPVEGDITIVTAWPAYGIDETQTVLPGDEIRNAAAMSQPVWPADPGPPAEA